jgi:AraC-like DNA-binding protein
MIYVTISQSYVTIPGANLPNFAHSKWEGIHLKLYIKYMVSNRCKMAVKEILKKLGLHFVVVDLGEIDIMEDISGERLDNFRSALSDGGFELMDNTRAILIERIINVIIQMVHHTEEMIKINFSEFLSEKLKHDYNYMSKIFSEVKGITIQQFIIIHKVEKIKELLIYGELNLTEISYRLNYSSVSHLSNQFRKVTGLSPSDFKHLKSKKRSSIEEIGN